MAKEIKFNVKLTVDGKEQLVTATTSVKDLQKGLSDAQGWAKRFQSSLITFNQSVEAIETVTDAIGQLNESVRSYLQSMAQAAQYTELQDKVLGEVRTWRRPWPTCSACMARTRMYTF